jgi:hypothetical protein
MEIDLISVIKLKEAAISDNLFIISYWLNHNN